MHLKLHFEQEKKNPSTAAVTQHGSELMQTVNSFYSEQFIKESVQLM